MRQVQGPQPSPHQGHSHSTKNIRTSGTEWQMKQKDPALINPPEKHLQTETGRYVLPIWRKNLSDLGAIIVLGCMAAIFRCWSSSNLSWLRYCSAFLPQTFHIKENNNWAPLCRGFHWQTEGSWHQWEAGREIFSVTANAASVERVSWSVHCKDFETTRNFFFLCLKMKLYKQKKWGNLMQMSLWQMPQFIGEPITVPDTSIPPTAFYEWDTLVVLYVNNTK